MSKETKLAVFGTTVVDLNQIKYARLIKGDGDDERLLIRFDGEPPSDSIELKDAEKTAALSYFQSELPGKV
jgi:hypothetical protein